MAIFATGGFHGTRYVKETEFGVTPTNPVMRNLRHTSNALILSKDSFQSEELRSDAQISDLRHGNRQASGDIGIEFSYAEYDDAPTVLSVLRRTEDRGVIITTHKIKSHISQIFKYAIACGLAYADPSRDLSPALQNRKSKPMPAIIEPKEVGKLMVAISGYPMPVVRSALMLGALTFVRPGELRTAEWEEFDMEAAEWRIPAEKMKMKRPHIVPLSTQALKILDKLKPLTGHGTYLFPSTRTITRPMSDMTVNVALRTLGYAQGEMTGRGFRAMANSLLAERGWSVDAIERQLAHVEGNKIRAAYHRSEHLDERRKMMQAWADYLVQLKTIL